MNHRFVVLKNYVFPIDCSCLNCTSAQKIELQKGSILTITPEKKYVENLGWYFLIDINSEYQVYINIYDFEKFYNDQKFCSLLDFDLKYNYFEYKVNEALDQKDSYLFNHYANELKEMNQLKLSILQEL